jgi:outer membrane protein TolC
MVRSIRRTSSGALLRPALVFCVATLVSTLRALAQTPIPDGSVRGLPSPSDSRRPTVTRPQEDALPPALPSDAPRQAGPAQPPSPSSASPGMPLVPGQVIQPIDLAGALRLAGARDLDIAIARQSVALALAELSQARALWLPSLFVGPTWTRLDGKVQSIQGPVITTSRSALFLGATAAGGTGFPATPPGSGYPPVNGLSSILRISDAIFEPLAARRVVAARQAQLQATTNDALLTAAEAYFDLQLAAGQLALSREAAENAKRLAEITRSFARSGAGLEADQKRSLAEQDRQCKNVEGAVGRLEIASAEIVRLLCLDPRVVVAPVEPAEMLLRLVPDDRPLDDLITEGLHCRPELAEAQALVDATLARLKQARLRPLVPSLAFSYAGGGFGGGTNAFFGNFGSRGEAAVSMFWELQNLGFTDHALARKSAAQQRTVVLQLLKVQNRVAAEVVSSYKARLAALRQVEQAGRALPEAIRSLELNFINIRRGAGLPGATRPIEVLQPVQALAQARVDYLDAVLAYNRAQFRLYRAIGWPLLVHPSQSPPPTHSAPTGR